MGYRCAVHAADINADVIGPYRWRPLGTAAWQDGPVVLGQKTEVPLVEAYEQVLRRLKPRSGLAAVACQFKPKPPVVIHVDCEEDVP